MNTERRSIFALPAGRRSKWAVFAVWILAWLVIFGADLPGKFADAENNESTSFLPGDAESTEVLSKAEDLQGGELAPAVILYRREAGLTPGDFAKIQDDAARLTEERFPAVVADGATAAAGGESGSSAQPPSEAPPEGGLPDGCAGPTTPLPNQPGDYAPFVGPVCSEDGNGGSRDRLHQGRRRGRQHSRPGRLLARHGVGPRRRPRGEDHGRRRLRRGRHHGLREHQRHAAAGGGFPGDLPADRHLPLADLLPDPARVGDAGRDPLAGDRLRDHRARGDGQRPVDLDHVDPGAGRGHGLRAVDRGPLQRGAALHRGPPPGHAGGHEARRARPCSHPRPR